MSPSSRHALHHLESEPFPSAIVRSSYDAIIAMTPDGQIVFRNEAAKHICG